MYYKLEFDFISRLDLSAGTSYIWFAGVFEISANYYLIENQ